MPVDVTTLEVPDLVKYARSVGVNPHGMRREEIEDEIALATQPIVPNQENRRIKTIEDIINALSPAVQKLQADMKQVQIATGLKEEDKKEEKKDD